MFIFSLIFIGCAITSQQQKEVEEELTVGIVQREIRIGMSAAEFIEVIDGDSIITKLMDEKSTITKLIYEKSTITRLIDEESPLNG